MTTTLDREDARLRATRAACKPPGTDRPFPPHAVKLHLKGYR